MPKCIDSIVSQTYRNLEILLVDDGSPDRCGEICDEYARQDARIKVIHKQNGGLADARNAALDVMTGEYAVCVDSDDYVSLTYVEGLYNLISRYGAQVAVNSSCSFLEGQEPCPVTGSLGEVVFSGLESVETMFYQKLFDTSAWGKMYKAELFDGVRYPKGLLFEDLPTTYRLLLKAEKVVFSDNPSYFYMLRADSIEGAAFSAKKLDSALELMVMMEQDAARFSTVIRSFHCRMVSFMFHLMLQMPENYAHRKDFENRIRKVRWSVLTDRRARKKTRVACLLSFAGFGLVQKVFNKIKKR